MNVRKQTHFLFIDDDEETIKIESNMRKIIDKTAKLSSELKIDNPLSDCNLFSYLLFNGIYSGNEEFYLEECGSKYPEEMITTGIADSYAISDMLELFLTKTEVENYAMTAFLKYDKISQNYEPDIVKRKISYPKVKSGRYYHAVNLVVDKKSNAHFVYDASMSLLLRVKNNQTLQVINGKGNLGLSYPDSNVFGAGSFDMGKTPSFLREVNKMKYPTKEKFIEVFQRDIELFRQNEKLIKSFKDDIQENVNEISQLIKK